MSNNEEPEQRGCLGVFFTSLVFPQLLVMFVGAAGYWHRFIGQGAHDVSLDGARVGHRNSSLEEVWFF